MGRPRMTAETTKQMTIRLIEAAHNLIVREGMEQVTIRKIAVDVGMNSASLYKYFKDLDELLLYACIDIFKAYTNDLIRHTVDHQQESPTETYLATWRYFCIYGFLYPACINHLFFSKHSDQLDAVIERYYTLYPDRLSGMPGQLQVMIRSSDLYKRNLEVLRPIFAESVSEETLAMINELTVSYFRMLLGEVLHRAEQIDTEQQTERMLTACRFLLHQRHSV